MRSTCAALADSTSRTSLPVVGSIACNISAALPVFLGNQSHHRFLGAEFTLYDEIFVQREEALATAISDVEGVADADRLVTVHAPHPRDDVQGHALLEYGVTALFEAQNIAFVPAGRKGDAD